MKFTIEINCAYAMFRVIDLSLIFLPFLCGGRRCRFERLGINESEEVD